MGQINLSDKVTPPPTATTPIITPGAAVAGAPSVKPAPKDTGKSGERKPKAPDVGSPKPPQQKT
jgi:hypothetical protein